MTSPACSNAGRRRAWRARAIPSLLAALLAGLLPSAACAFDPFVVKDIRVEGVQRTEAGTVFSYLPIKVGERVDDAKAAEAVKALFATGFFRDVRMQVTFGRAVDHHCARLDVPNQVFFTTRWECRHYDIGGLQ